MSTETPQPVSRVMWRDPSEIMPDDDITVLIALDEGTVTEAWKDGSYWRLENSLSFPVVPRSEEAVPRVMAWAQMPEHPFADEVAQEVRP